ncbi:MAG: DUF1501 domain-containing protein [Planctomycetia bacterium]|nr:DUF1501 domain-containing protein [Planctomycetia bacterium]
MFANGGPSHLDTFDPKPVLAKYAGREIPNNLPTERRTGAALPSPFTFARHGASGLEVSELFPSVARHADRLLVVRSMHADVPNHEPSLMLMNCGDARLVRPAAGAWVTYGLGTENQNLPGFVAMCPGGYPIKGTENWRSAFLPGAFQGTYVDTRKQKIDDLVQYVRHPLLDRDTQGRQVDLTTRLDRRHLEARQHDPLLEARLESLELAWRMQAEAGEAFDVAAGVKSLHVPYKGSAQAHLDLIAGNVQMMFDTTSSAMGQIKAGKLRALAVTSKARSPAAPEVPTMEEAGIKDYEANFWYSVFVPARTPRQIIDKLNEAIRVTLANPAMQKKFVEQGLDPQSSSPKELGDLMARDSKRLGEVVRKAGITAE